MHASSRNTGVVHSPFYLNPKTKKVLAKSALISYNMWKTLAKKEKIPMVQFEGSSVALGRLCGLQFRVSSVSFTSLSDANIKSILKESGND